MKIERKKLLEALEPLKPALAVRTVIAAQTQVWFDKEFAYAHDGGFGVRSAFETPFDFGVPGKLLLGLLESSDAEEIILEPKDTALVFKSGKSTVKLTILDKSARPTFYSDDPGKPVTTIKVSKELVEGLRRVFMLRPANPKRLEHHGVCLFPVESEMDLYTTDSKSIAVAPVAQKYKGKKLVIPRVFAEQLVAQCEENAELEIFGDHFRVNATEKVTLYSNVFDTSGMQDLPATVDRAYDTKAAPLFGIPKGFDAALERAVLMAGSAEEPVVTLKTHGKKLTISGAFRSGDFSEEFDVDKNLPERSVEVLAKPLMTTAAVQQLMVGPVAVALRGKDDFLYFLALGK